MKTLIGSKHPDVIARLSAEARKARRCTDTMPVRSLSATYHAAEHFDVACVLLDAALTADLRTLGLFQLLRRLSIPCCVVANGSLPSNFGDVPVIQEADVSAWIDTSLTHPDHGLGLPHPSSDTVILIASSTGGVDALRDVLSAFDDTCPPTLIVQHTGASFSESLAKLLDQGCHAQVSEGKPGQQLVPGQVFIAPSNRKHMVLRLKGSTLTIDAQDGPAVNGHRPSADVLFKSAVPIAARCRAVVLTGMGCDGADGLLALRKAGAETFAQDQATSVVFGMPRVAFECGATDAQVPLHQIAEHLLQPAQPRRRHS